MTYLSTNQSMFLRQTGPVSYTHLDVYKRQMEDTDRVHYAITDPGGASPNVVQSHAESRYFVRSTTNPKLSLIHI